MTRGRIAVTGVGMVTALGDTASASFERLVRGDRGFSDVTLFDTAGQRTRHAAQVPGFRVEDVVPKGEAERWSRTDALALCAAREALGDVNPAAGPPLGLAVGVTTGGMLEAEHRLLDVQGAGSSGSVERLLSYPLSSTATRLGSFFGITGPARTVSSACSSGANALVLGAAWLTAGRVTRALVGGADALAYLTFTGFNALGATDVVPCRPFDRRRAGLTLGEGAAFLLLETEAAARERGAPVLAWFSGSGVRSEAHHITQPEQDGGVPAACITAALRGAGLGPSEVDYVNAHGTGTVSNDTVESLALRESLGDELPRIRVSSAKGQIGHTLGAAGAIEAAITVLAVARGVIPPTGGLVEPDPACALRHVVGVAERAEIRAALSSSFGFGGTCTALLFEHASHRDRALAAPPAPHLVVTGSSTIGPRGVLGPGESAGYAAPRGTAAAGSLELPIAPLDRLEPARSRRFDRAAALVTVGAGCALQSGPEGVPPDAGLVVGSAFGNVERTIAFVRAAVEKGPRRAPPAEFPHLLPSAASGNASIYLGLHGPILSTSDLAATAEAAIAIAADWVAAGFADCLAAGSADPRDAFVGRILGPLCEAETGSPRSEGSAWVVIESRDHATARGARVLAVIHAREELSAGSAAARRIGGPRAGARAVVVSSRDPIALGPLLERSGWGAAPSFSTAPRTGFHEGAGGFAFAAAVDLLASAQAEDALVVGWNRERIFTVHLVSPP